MKRLASIVLSVMMLVASADAFAQTRAPRRNIAPSARGFGLTFGYVHSSYSTTDWATDEVRTSPGLDGFMAGLNKDFRIIPGALYFQAGLSYMYQNDAYENTIAPLGLDTGLRVVGDRTEHYISLPLKMKYTVPLTDRIGLGVEAGPTFMMGLSSKMKYRTRFSDEEASYVTYNIYNGKSNTDHVLAGKWDIADWLMNDSGLVPDGRMNRFDIMMGAALGADFFDLFELRIGYDWGMINRFRKELADDMKLHRGQFTLSASIRF